MTSRLNPYLTFDGNAREAMETYQSIFGGQLRVSTFGEFGSPDPQIKDKVMHAMLETPQGYTLMASDTAPGMPFTPGNANTVSLSGDDGDDLRDFWTKLADGATVSVPLEKQMWGDEFGQLIDKFGVPWMVNISAAQ
ncbi:VOC family protein [Actinoplanes teichomyceticus]|uniref:PhnB protein n=1 Tax=Actinoplanes teichomyceticus TaxID=1867 RepID=A0A561WLF7_ACTTI|nr:VOC family protein [Actinoplanes teichomyceticus]TWG24701.1 PhnB protein [Actinoplanes teichomyceticus]GIF14634.1 VOC family protein [Actinoplanes teichomyceticus]